MEEPRFEDMKVTMVDDPTRELMKKKRKEDFDAFLRKLEVKMIDMQKRIDKSATEKERAKQEKLRTKTNIIYLVGGLTIGYLFAKKTGGGD